MFKKIVLILGIVTIIIVLIQLYKPPFPVEGINGTEAIAKLDSSSKNIVEIRGNDNHIWYFTAFDKGTGYDRLISEIEKEEWVYVTQDGAGRFFQKNDHELIVTCEMWTSKYIVCKVPDSFK